MKDELISLEVAKLARKKHFNEVSYYIYSKYGLEKYTITVYHKNIYQGSDPIYLAPTQSLLQRWLREKYNCIIVISPHRDYYNECWKSKEDILWEVSVNYYGTKLDIEYTDKSDFNAHHFNTYEKALEEGLKQGLMLIKND